MGNTGNAGRDWISVGYAWLLGFAMFAALLCVPPIAHIIKETFSISHAEVSLLFAIPLAVLAVAAIPSGILADRIGVRKATGIGAIVITAGSLLRGTATTYLSLLGFTSLFGLGLALVYPNLPKIVSGRFPKEKVGLVTGIYSTGIAAGSTIPFAITLPVLFPIAKTPQGIFFIWSIPLIVAAVLAWFIIKDEPNVNLRPGKVVRDGASASWMLRDRALWLVALMLFALCIQFYVWVGWTPALMMLKGATPELASLIASIRGWITIPVIFLVPFISYKVGLRKPFLIISPLILTLASIWAIFIDLSWSWLLMIIVGIQSSGSFSMILALPAELVPEEQVGAASGMVLSFGYIGGLIGPWLAGYIFDISGKLDIPLLFLSGVALVWTIIAVFMPETGQRSEKKA